MESDDEKDEKKNLENRNFFVFFKRLKLIPSMLLDREDSGPNISVSYNGLSISH